MTGYKTFIVRVIIDGNEAINMQTSQPSRNYAKRRGVDFAMQQPTVRNYDDLMTEIAEEDFQDSVEGLSLRELEDAEYSLYHDFENLCENVKIEVSEVNGE